MVAAVPWGGQRSHRVPDLALGGVVYHAAERRFPRCRGASRIVAHIGGEPCQRILDQLLESGAFHGVSLCCQRHA